MKLADLPSGIHPPAGHKPDKTWRRERRQSTRREFLRLATRAGIATGLAFASLMPTARRAHATDMTPVPNGLFTTLNRCHGPTNDNWLELAGDTGCCECGSNVADAYYNSEDWHRHHTVYQGTNVRIHYGLRDNSCGRGVSGTSPGRMRGFGILTATRGGVQMVGGNTVGLIIQDNGRVRA